MTTTRITTTITTAAKMTAVPSVKPDGLVGAGVVDDVKMLVSVTL